MYVAATSSIYGLALNHKYAIDEASLFQSFQNNGKSTMAEDMISCVAVGSSLMQVMVK